MGSKFLESLLPKSSKLPEKNINITQDNEEVSTKSKSTSFVVSKNNIANQNANATFNNENQNVTFNNDIPHANATFEACNRGGNVNTTFDGCGVQQRNPVNTTIDCHTGPTNNTTFNQHDNVPDSKTLRSKVTFGPMSVIPDMPREPITEFDKLQNMVAKTDYKQRNRRSLDSGLINTTFEAAVCKNVNTTFDGATSDSVANGTFRSDPQVNGVKKLRQSIGEPKFAGTPIKAIGSNATFDNAKSPSSNNNTFTACDTNNVTHQVCNTSLQGMQSSVQNATFEAEGKSKAATNCTFDQIVMEEEKIVNTTFEQPSAGW